MVCLTGAAHQLVRIFSIGVHLWQHLLATYKVTSLGKTATDVAVNITYRVRMEDLTGNNSNDFILSLFLCDSTRLFSLFWSFISGPPRWIICLSFVFIKMLLLSSHRYTCGRGSEPIENTLIRCTWATSKHTHARLLDTSGWLFICPFLQQWRCDNADYCLRDQ